jgi:ribonuclease HII
MRSCFVGIDESGVGSLAGSLFVVALSFSMDTVYPKHPLFHDSKRVSGVMRRNKIDDILPLLVWGCVVRVPAPYINAHSIWDSWDDALDMILGECLRYPNTRNVLVDGAFKSNRKASKFPFNLSAEPSADRKYPYVSAASNVAKFFQEEEMDDLNTFYPEYGFDMHRGYGTELHHDMLKRHGRCSVHRTGFGSVNMYPLRDDARYRPMSKIMQITIIGGGHGERTCSGEGVDGAVGKPINPNTECGS